ncbi:MAG: hypothetical protein ACREJX_19745, partial [Polyangiaceae bacterium]
NNANDPEGSCIDCEGTYACISNIQGSMTSYLTLASAVGGCATLDDQGNAVGELVCGGQFLTSDNGQSTLVATWSGGTGHFTITGTIDGQNITADCVLTNAPQPQPTPVGGTGTSNGFDGG